MDTNLNPFLPIPSCSYLELIAPPDRKLAIRAYVWEAKAEDNSPDEKREMIEEGITGIPESHLAGIIAKSITNYISLINLNQLDGKTDESTTDENLIRMLYQIHQKIIQIHNVEADNIIELAHKYHGGFEYAPICSRTEQPCMIYDNSLVFGVREYMPIGLMLVSIGKILGCKERQYTPGEPGISFYDFITTKIKAL